MYVSTNDTEMEGSAGSQLAHLLCFGIGLIIALLVTFQYAAVHLAIALQAQEAQEERRIELRPED